MVLGRAGLVRSLILFTAIYVGKGRQFVAVWHHGFGFVAAVQWASGGG
jgi:hypothetical protein